MSDFYLSLKLAFGLFYSFLPNNLKIIKDSINAYIYTHIRKYIHIGNVPMNIHWKDWCWNWSSNTLATWCEELTHWKRPWCWEGLGAGGEGDDRGWDGWMASLIRWTWVWVGSGVGDGQGGLACCSPWGHKKSDFKKWLSDWTELIRIKSIFI